MKILSQQYADQHTLRATRTCAIIIVCLQPIAFIIVKNAGTASAWLSYINFFTAIFVLILTIKFPKMKLKYSASLLLSMLLMSFFCSFAVYQTAVQKSSNVPFFTIYKLMALVIATLAPSPPILGYLIIAFCFFIPPIQVLFFLPEIISMSNYYEPLLTMGYSIASFWVLSHNLKRQKLYVALIEAQGKEKTLRDFAKVATAIRDLTNTPLQSLELLTNSLKGNKIKAEKAGELLGNVTSTLDELVQILSEQEKKLEEATPESIDSKKIIREVFNPENH